MKGEAIMWPYIIWTALGFGSAKAAKAAVGAAVKSKSGEKDSGRKK